MPGHAWWGAAQWAAYLVYQEQPIKAASKAALHEMEAAAGDTLPGQAYAALMLDDPMLALRLIKAANNRLPHRMARDITTPLGVVMALGTVIFALAFVDELVLEILGRRTATDSGEMLRNE